MLRLFGTYYHSIHTCSIYAWSRTRKHNNLAYLQKKHKHTPSNKIPTDATIKGERAYMDLLTELWFEFGQSKELKKEIELRKDLMEMNLMYLTTGDEGYLNDINIISADLEKMLKESANMVDFDFDEQVARQEERLNREISLKETSVFDYYKSTNK